MSPTATTLTEGPTFVTRPTISCPGTAGIHGGHNAPFIAAIVKVGMADAAEQNFDLNVTIAGVATLDGC